MFGASAIHHPIAADNVSNNLNKKTGGIDIHLQKELLEMMVKEQNLREQWMNEIDITAKETLREKVHQIDTFHLSRLKDVFKNYGWPGFSVVGPEGSHAFWLLVQHAPDQQFQNQCLERLEQAVVNQDASGEDLAYLKDRVCVEAGKKQIYGTQVNEDCTFYPIEDEEHVNERRLAIGLPSIEKYLEFIQQINKK